MGKGLKMSFLKPDKRDHIPNKNSLLWGFLNSVLPKPSPNFEKDHTPRKNHHKCASSYYDSVDCPKGAPSVMNESEAVMPEWHSFIMPVCRGMILFMGMGVST